LEQLTVNSKNAIWETGLQVFSKWLETDCQSIGFRQKDKKTKRQKDRKDRKDNGVFSVVGYGWKIISTQKKEPFFT
jgi:hypothetical protein